MDVRVVRAVDAADGDLAGVDVLVVGAPSPVPPTSPPPDHRDGSVSDTSAGDGREPRTGEDGDGGVGAWLAGLHDLHVQGAAFDTRLTGPVAVTGRASRGIATVLSRLGISVGVRGESFLVDGLGGLLPGESDRARSWGERLADMVSDDATSSSR